MRTARKMPDIVPRSRRLDEICGLRIRNFRDCYVCIFKWSVFEQFQIVADNIDNIEKREK